MLRVAADLCCMQVPSASENRINANRDNLATLIPGPYPCVPEPRAVTSPGGTNSSSGFAPVLKSASDIHKDMNAFHHQFAADRSPGTSRFSRTPLTGAELADKAHASVRSAVVNQSHWSLTDAEAANSSTAAERAATQRRNATAAAAATVASNTSTAAYAARGAESAAVKARGRSLLSSSFSLG